MKKVALLVAAAGAVGWAAYAYRDRILAAMLDLATRLQALGEDPTEEEDELEASFHYPKKEEDLGAR